jgi:sRNA-binding protein
MARATHGGGFQPRFHKFNPSFQRFLKHHADQKIALRHHLYGQTAGGFLAIHQQALKNKARDEAEAKRKTEKKQAEVEAQLRHDQRELLDAQLIKEGLRKPKTKKKKVEKNKDGTTHIPVKDLLSDLANPDVDKSLNNARVNQKELHLKDKHLDAQAVLKGLSEGKKLKFEYY